MIEVRFALALLLGAALAGCGGDAGQPTSTPPALCVSEGCGALRPLLAVPDAENLLYSDTGRLFVSGGTGVFEVREEGGALRAEPLAPEPCNFTGLAQRGAVLYAACFDGRLYAAQLTATPRLSPIHELGIASPNGMTRGPDGALYIANGPLDAGLSLPDPKIVRVAFDANDPMQVASQSDWLASGLMAPNGLASDTTALYVTDSSAQPLTLGRVLRVALAPDGSAQAVEEVARFNAVLDDLSLVGDQLLVSLFTEGAVALVAPDGSVTQRTGALGMAFPSSVMAARPPLFPAGALLITEKGLLGETSSAYGNRLSLFAPQP